MQRPDLAADARLSTAAGRLTHRDEVEKAGSAWCALSAPQYVRDRCQAEGVPAGNMLRLSEFLKDPHFNTRGFFRVLSQPSAGRGRPVENGPVACSESLPAPQIERAPAQGEHTVRLAKELLGLSSSEIQALVASGDLERGASASKGAWTQRYKTLAVR